jgi:hypothetical protein
MAHFKAYKIYFLQNIRTLFITNLFFILRQKLKPVTKSLFLKSSIFSVIETWHKYCK